MEIDKEQPSNYEIQLALNDRYYKGHFKSIENVKRVLSETQKLHDQIDDERLKQNVLKFLKQHKNN